MKILPFYVSGRELISLSQLPRRQAEFLERHIAPEMKITVHASDEHIHDCIPYSEYEKWISVYNLNLSESFFSDQF
jgi:hypothetical protein